MSHRVRSLVIAAFVTVWGCGGGSTSSDGGGGAGGTTSGAGTSGAAGTTGAAGTVGAAGTTGGAGTSGAAGTTGGAGTLGAAGTTGAGGRGGAGGTSGSAGRGGSGGGGVSGSGGAAGTSGAGGRGGNGTAGRGGTGGTSAAVTYEGCTYVGAIDRVAISKCDETRGIAFNVTLLARGAGGASGAGLTVPAGWQLERSEMGTAANCGSRASGGPGATSTTGVVEWAALGGFFPTYPSRANIDVTLTFPPGDGSAASTEQLTANNVNVAGACQ